MPLTFLLSPGNGSTFSGTVSASGSETILDANSAIGRVLLSVASSQAGVLRLSITHDNGTTWTVVREQALASATAGTSGYTNIAFVDWRLPGQFRLDVYNSGGSTANVRGCLCVLPDVSQ